MEVRETDALMGEGVNVRRADDRVAKARKVAVPNVVGHDEDALVQVAQDRLEQLARAREGQPGALGGPIHDNPPSGNDPRLSLLRDPRIL